MRKPAGLFLFLTATLCSAQAPAPARARPTTTYHSDSMNFDFVYPSSFAARKGTTDDVPGKEQGKGSGAEKADAGCVSVPVAVMDMRTGFNMIFLKSYDQACLSKEITAAGLGTAAANVLTDTLEQLGKPAISSSTDYGITGHSASAVFGSVKVPHASGKSVIYGAASCVISGRNIACFQFLSNDCPTLAVLSASTVKFTDAAATPVIPAKVAPACKVEQAELHLAVQPNDSIAISRVSDCPMNLEFNPEKRVYRHQLPNCRLSETMVRFDSRTTGREVL